MRGLHALVPTAPSSLAVDDPRSFGVAELEGERLVRVHEKPAHPPSNLAVIGIYAFTSAVFDVIEHMAPSARGELEIADAISGLLRAGRTVTARVTGEYWIDTGKMEDMLAANRVVLAGLLPGIAPSAMLKGTTSEGPVSIGEGASIEDSSLIGPVVVGARARLLGCTAGPNVAIGADCIISNVAICNSIVMEQSELRDCSGIEASMIGRFTCVSGAPAGARLTLGDHSRFEAAG